MKELVKNSVETYYGLGDSDMLEYYRPIDDPITKSPIPPYFEIMYLHGINTTENPMIYNLTVDDLGPFGGEDADVKAFMFKVSRMMITYNIEHLIPVEGISNLNCYAWKVI